MSYTYQGLLLRVCLSARDASGSGGLKDSHAKCKSSCCFFFRSIHLAYVKDVEVKGIQAYRFAPPSDVLMNPEDNPTNAGFCVPAKECLGTGVLKVSVCRDGMTFLFVQA